MSKESTKDTGRVERGEDKAQTVEAERHKQEGPVKDTIFPEKAERERSR